MINEIKDLVSLYNNRNKFADYYFICNLVSIIKKYLDLDKYINDISIDFDDVTTSMATYDMVNNDLFVHLGSILNHSSNNNIIKDRVEYMNWYITYVLIHEMVHAHQKKMTIEKPNPYISLVLYPIVKGNVNIFGTLSIDIDRYVEFAKRFISEGGGSNINSYMVNPVERSANIFASSTIKSCVDNELLFKYYNEIYNKHLINGYILDDNVVISPLENFFGYYDMEELMKVFDWYDVDDDVMARNVYMSEGLPNALKYGLPIDLTEYNKLDMRRLLSKEIA